MPHSLRISIFFLRLALGLSFFYLGWSALFDNSLMDSVRERSLGGLYTWLSMSTPIAGVPSAVFAWIFLIAGICITLGIFTRPSSLITIVVILVAWLPGISIANFHITQLINDELIAVFALFVLIFGRAGTYIGIDKFLRWSRKHKDE